MVNIATIIQGPLNSVSLRNIPNYLKFGSVVVSYWQGDNKQLLLDNCPISILNRTVLVESMLPPEITWHNAHNIWKQIATTIRGVCSSVADTIVKVRSDEAYTNLQPILDEHERTEKITTCNIFFRKDWHHKFHISDHLIVAKRELFLRALLFAKEACEAKRCGGDPPEVTLTKAFLTAKNVVIDNNNSKEIMKKFFSVVPITKLGNFQASIYGKKMTTYCPDVFEDAACIFDNLDNL